MDDGFHQYPHIPILASMKPTKRILLGQRLFWTEKEDGSNVHIQVKSGEPAPLISSRNNEQAASDIKALVYRTEEYRKILELLQENPNYIVYVEACKKGKSVTRVKTYERDQLFLFDIFDKKAEKYLPYVLVHQIAYHYQIPIVKLWAETQHKSVPSLMKMAEEALAYCKEKNQEGMVIKAYKVPDDIKGYYKEFNCGLVQAKVKLDLPKPEKMFKEEGDPEYPPMPENEAFGAISKVDADVGLTGDAAHDMPLIAKYIGEEQKKHLYSKPERSLYSLWQDYMAEKEQ
jgi:hypothetical protein